MNNNIINEIDEYWSDRALGYSKVNQEELLGMQKTSWLREIERQIAQIYPGRDKSEIHILDIGTGPGFFAIILTEAGYQVTAVDYTEAMLTEAKNNAGTLADQIIFKQMDGQNLIFPQQSFDVVISRNLTWVLEKPEEAYQSWQKVLKKDGLMLNFDANWYAYLYNDELRKGYDQDRRNVAEAGCEDHYTCTDIDAMEQIAYRLPLSSIKRPQWDVQVLQKLSWQNITTDFTIGERVWSPVEKINYASTPMFMVAARK